MREEMLAPGTQDLAFGCIFCTTGKEQAVAELINRFSPCARAIVARHEQFHSDHGKKSKVEKVMLPGYVFFRAPADSTPFIPKEHVIRLLTVDDGVWQLAGEDERFVEWLFRYNGLLGFSKAYKEGDRIRIISGPLKDMEGQIRRIDKRGRSGQVALDFHGRVNLAWLCFDLIDPLEEGKCGASTI